MKPVPVKNGEATVEAFAAVIAAVAVPAEAAIVAAVVDTAAADAVIKPHALLTEQGIFPEGSARLSL